MANQILAVVYTDDHGNSYVTGMDSEIFGQETAPGSGTPKVGGRLFNPATDEHLDAFPSNRRPRRVIFRYPGSRKLRYITALSSDGALWVNPGGTLTIEDSDGAPQVCAKVGIKAESFGRVRQKVATV